MIVKTKVNINYNGERFEVGETLEYDEKKYPRSDFEELFEVIKETQKTKKKGKE